MIENQKICFVKVIGLFGEQLMLDMLLLFSIMCWVVCCKVEVVVVVNGGLLIVDDVCECYGLIVEEFVGWQCVIDWLGMLGFCVMCIQYYKLLYEW